MAKTAPQLKSIIKRYRAELEKMEIHAERVMLYGSQVSQTSREGSDIDLIIISSDFESYNKRERLEILGLAAARILEPVQAYGISPEEIKTNQLMPIWEYILQEQAVPV